MKKSTIIKSVVTGIFLILTIASLIVLGKLNVIPTKLFIGIIAVIAVLNILADIFMFLKGKKFLKVLSVIIYIVLAAVLGCLLYYGRTTDKFLNSAFGNAEKEYKIPYYIISKSDIKKEELPDKTIFYYSSIQNPEKILNKLAEENIKTFVAVDDLKECLENEVILLDKANYLLIPELFDDINISDYHIIYEITLTIKISNEAIGEEELDEEHKNLYENLTPGEYYNIFIGGYDFTETWMDFNMLISVNKTNDEILITTIPRDYYITDAFVGKKDKLSNMGFRGIETNMSSVAKLFGVKIDYYIKINTKSVVALVDAVGGITYCSDQEFTTSHAMILGDYDDSKGQKLHVKKGCQGVNGIEALTIARERLAFKSGDNQRQKNCAQIMKAILNKMKTPSMATKYPSVLNAVNGFYTTTIPREFVTDNIKDLIENPNWKIETQSVTGSHGNNHIFFGPQTDYVMYPNESSVKAAKNKIQGLKYRKLSEL